MDTVLPHGSWPSHVSADDALGAGVSMTELAGDGADLYWLESRPLENGRMTLMRRRDGEIAQVTSSPINVRSRIWEYGGGAWDARDGVVVVSDLSSGQLLDVTDQSRPITPVNSQVRFGGLQVHPGLDLVLAVREDHRPNSGSASAPEPASTIVALRLSGDNPDFGTVLVSGADFHAGPRLSTDQRLAWFEWDHPQMPWDQTRVRVAQLVADQQGWRLDEPATVFEQPGVSAQHPQWSQHPQRSQPDALVFSHDANGFWNHHRWGGGESEALSGDPHDFDHPVWTMTRPTWAPVGDRVLTHRMVDGWPQLGWLHERRFEPYEVPGLADVDSVVVIDGRPHLLASFADGPSALISVAPDPGEATGVGVIHQPSESTLTARPPRSVVIESADGPVQAWFHAPDSADVRAPEGDLPPAIVKSHGGPTSFSSASFDPVVQFWTSRGFAVVDVNYGGSTGFGRAYRDRLKQRWGVADVADCVAVVEHLVAAGEIDPHRVSITGGSAGGYTTLQSLVSTSTYTAGVSRYGIGDLEMLATDTHKFESRYLDSLVGPYPEQRQVYLDRSPIRHLDRLATPMLILQGLDDKVVPPNQAESMAAAVRAKGLPVALVTFEGEGHGFRGLSARRQALLSELAFYSQLWGLDPSEDDLPRLDLSPTDPEGPESIADEHPVSQRGGGGHLA